MSERGSFVTGYLFCKQCEQILFEALCTEPDKFLCAARVPAWPESGMTVLPIIAGKVGGLYTVDDSELMNRLQHVSVCHEVHFAVLLDGSPPVAYVMRANQPGMTQFVGED
jgi:hypothetical protein